MRTCGLRLCHHRNGDRLAEILGCALRSQGDRKTSSVGQHFLICHLKRIDLKPEPVPDIEWFPGEPLRAPGNPLLNSSHGRWVLILADQAVSLEPSFVTIEEIVGQEVRVDIVNNNTRRPRPKNSLLAMPTRLVERKTWSRIKHPSVTSGYLASTMIIIFLDYAADIR